MSTLVIQFTVTCPLIIITSRSGCYKITNIFSQDPFPCKVSFNSGLRPDLQNVMIEMRSGYWSLDEFLLLS